MPRSVSISEAALQWIEQEAERISTEFGPAAANIFKKRIDKAIANVSAFPNMTGRGDIPGSRTVTVSKRTILTLVERNGELVVAAARSHWQEDSHSPNEAYDADGVGDDPDTLATPKM